MKYLLLINYGLENWLIEEYDSIPLIEKEIQNGKTLGREFKVALKLNIKIEIPNIEKIN